MRPMASSLRRHRGYALFLALAAWFVVQVAFFAPGMTLLDRMEWRTVDWRYDMRGKQPPQSDVVILAADEQAMTLGRWPWPRDRFAQVIELLKAAGARQIVFDIFFFEPDPSPDGRLRDAQFAKTIAAAGNVYLPCAGAPAPAENAPRVSAELATQAWSDVRVEPGQGLSALASLYEMPALKAPLPALLQAARGLGYVDVGDTGDGVFRHAIPVAMCGGALYPALSVVVAADRLGVKRSDITVHPGEYVLLGRERGLPIDRGGRMLINFAGPRYTYPTHSLTEVIGPDAKSDLSFVRDKTVLIGGTAAGMNDLKASPYSAVFDGVETQANIIGNILSGDFVHRVKPEVCALIGLGLVLLVGLAFPRLPIPLGAGVIVATFAGYNALAVWAFDHTRITLDMAAPNATLLLATLALLTYRIAIEEQERRRAQVILSRFVPPEVARHLAEGEAEATMQGERREITVLFADIRDFTAASEQAAPEAAVELLNRYFRLMHETIWEFGGTLDKYMGNGLMAFFNAPQRQEDHARRAVLTAIEMQRRVNANRAEWTYYGMPELRIGIGISTGLAVVGYVGSRERMQYTVIGSHVNLASRLEELTKQYNEPILISEETYQQAKADVRARNIGETEVKGFTEKVTVYAVETEGSQGARSREANA